MTVITENGLSPYNSISSRSWPYIALHGLHQLAENIRTTTLPRRSVKLTREPSTPLPHSLRGDAAYWM